jgi:hypothetical protein
MAEGRSYTQRQPNRTKGSKRKSVIDEPAAFDASRYINAVKILFEDAACEELSAEEFPTIKSDAPAQVGKTGPAAPVSLRAKSGGVAAAPGAVATSAATGGPIFMFVVGGMTYSEMRSAYEISTLLGRDFYIGSDSIITPATFMDRLRSLSN